jgi:hypothetical protein
VTTAHYSLTHEASKVTTMFILVSNVFVLFRAFRAFSSLGRKFVMFETFK